MPDGSGSFAVETARIGPNAILQLSDPMGRLLGPAAFNRVLAGEPLPSGAEMVPEGRVARVHDRLWRLYPDQAATVSRLAGQGTARYIRDNRIPKAARLALRLLPKSWGERMLTRAIQQHAWTFCGSGRLELRRDRAGIHFMLHDNPLADTHAAPGHPCLWHQAVFAALFTAVLGVRYDCVEPTCRGCGGALCRFVLRRAGP